MKTAGSGKKRVTPEENVDPRETIERLRVNALIAHQTSMGAGDQLVQLLLRTVRQMEKSHNRVQTMSTVLFVAGLCVLGVGVYETVAGNGDVWAALLGTSGGIAALAAVFWTAPLDKVSASINDLVKLETVFLGYIRVIGEIDSFFQMQYLDIISGSCEDDAKDTLANAIRDTTSQMKDMMSTAIELLDNHRGDQHELLERLQQEAAAVDERLKALEETR
jgi:hypothetical protein